MTVVRLKDIVTINQRALPDSTAPDFTFRYVDISCVNPDGKVSLPDTTVTFEAAPSRARRLAAPGDVIVSTVRTYLRAIARVPVATASTWSLFGLVARSCRTTCSSSSTRTSHVNTSPGTQSDRGRPTST